MSLRHCVDIGGHSAGVADRGSVSNLEKGATEGVVQLSRITLLSLAGKVFSGGAGEEGLIDC